MGKKDNHFKKRARNEVGSYNWADSQLKYIIGILQGKNVICSRKGRIHLAIITKELLKEYGYTWHVERIDNWIHRTSKLEQPKRADSRAEQREDSLKPKISFEKYLEEAFK